MADKPEAVHVNNPLEERVDALEKTMALVKEALRILDGEGVHGHTTHNALRAAALMEFGPLPDDPEEAAKEQSRRERLAADLGAKPD